MEPRSPALLADSLLSEPPGKPKNTGVGGLSLLQQIFPAQKSNRGLPYCRRILYQLSYQVIIIHTFKKIHTFVLLKKNISNFHYINYLLQLYCLPIEGGLMY